MTESNKKSLLDFAKVAALFVLGMVAIITSAGVWNGVHGGAIGSFYGWVAGLNLIAEGFGVYSLYKKFFPSVVKSEASKTTVTKAPVVESVKTPVVETPKEEVVKTPAKKTTTRKTTTKKAVEKKVAE